MAHISPSASVMPAAPSTTTDSIGPPAPPNDPGDSTDVGASAGQPSARGSETQTDITAADTPPVTPSTDDSESSGSGEADSSTQTRSLEVSDDSWIEDWDMVIHRCSHCDRPFVSAARLSQHVQAWHTSLAPVLHPYRKPPSDTGDGSSELVVIAPHGDLILSVSEGPAKSGSQDVRFQVASSTLWLASRVFNSMFGPTSRFQEATALRRSHITGFPPVVVALDDDPEALKFVLTALHFQFDPLSILTYELMVEVAAICDKYELHQAFQPIADQYLLPIGMKISDFAGSSNWLLISYVFGYEQIFAAVSKYIILRLTGAQQPSAIDCRTPAKVTDALAAKRNSIIRQLESCLEKVRRERSITRGQVVPAVRCLKQSMRKECEALQLGNLEGNLLRLGLPEDVRAKSVREICDEVELFAPLSVECVHQSNNAQNSGVGFGGAPHGGLFGQSSSTSFGNVPHKTENSHHTCSWVPDLKLLVSNLLSSEEGLNLKDIPSSVRAHK